ncbi:bile acid:sodium symporter family protein [Aurantiacibacter suaedae]|uniref:bile acid:sodium symporter family protein n=1 Tax=Aurantiacibacter suaedae TaxID=2545755 RepID=UPI0010F856AD|nr:bile acid:sodium symporter family protein [Aurantiacibacter suaedae]
MKALLARLRIDPFILLLLATVGLASLLPARGLGADIAGGAADIGIVLLFFLHGARLSRQAVIDGARHWRLHATVGAVTYGVFPLLGLGIALLPFLDPWLRTGLVFLTLLPSTVQSSIAFTAMARGNVAGAVCSAAFSNLAGIVITPVLVALLLTGEQGGISGKAVLTIVVQLLLPFLAGHLLQPLIGSWIKRQRALLLVVDRGSVLLVVYAAFSAAVVEGLWSRVSPADMLLILALSAVLLAFVLTMTALLGRWLGFAREDVIVLQFCGSKKSLATGVPMAGVLFPAATVGAVILPLMVFHQLQLMVCAVLAARYGRKADEQAE